VSSATTRGLGSGWVDSGVALLDIDNLPFFVDHERGAIRHSGFHQHSVVLADFAFGEIAEKRDLNVVLGGEFFLGRGVICTDTKDFRLTCFKFGDTSLVCREFLGSTTCESGGEESQDHVVLAAEVA